MKDSAAKEEKTKGESSSYHLNDGDFSSGDEETTLIDSQDCLNSTWKDSRSMGEEPIKEDFSHVSIFSQPLMSFKALGRVSV